MKCYAGEKGKIQEPRSNEEETRMEKGKLGHESNRGKKDQNSPEYIRYDLKQAVVAGGRRPRGTCRRLKVR